MLYISYHDILGRSICRITTNRVPADPREILHGLKAVQDDAIKW